MLHAVLVSALIAAGPAPKPTVLVVPWVTSSGPEYAWIGQGAAAMLSAQLDRAEANVVSPLDLQQVLRRRDLTAESLQSPKVAAEVARAVGASRVIIGSYQATWPDIQVLAKLIDGVDGRTLEEAWDLAHLEDLIGVLDEVGGRLLTAGGFGKHKAGALGTKNLYAFRDAMLGQDILSLSSLSPRGVLRLPQGTVKKARLHCAEAVRRDPQWAPGLGCQAAAEALLATLDAGSFDVALELAERARKAQGASVLAAFAGYYARVKKNDDAGAEKAVEAALAAQPGQLALHVLLGDHRLAKDASEPARAAFQRALDRAPENPALLIKLGKALARLGEGPKALEVTQRALALSGNEPLVWVELGSRQIDLSKLDEAEASLKKAISLDPRDGRAYLRLGYVYLLRKKPDQAVAILERSIAESDLEDEWRSRALAHYDLARAHGQLGALDKAFADLDQAIANGFTDRLRVEAEADLATLKKDPRWQGVMQRMAPPTP